ncbi:MAG: hypothetical protein ABI666_00335 [Ferruginibacter sp.]
MSEEDNISPEEIPQEQLVSKEPSDETTSSAESIIEAEQPQTTNYKPETENMEVHHHTHPAHGKKTWKDYFWEFLMLFLAVFCGFLAEYQLEHVIEHQREKEFIRSMVEDLKDDQEKLNIYVADLQSGVKRMDTLINILVNNSLIKTNGNQLYYLGRMSPRIIIFSNNNRTLEQLKNSGSFRLIRNTGASNKIMTYYNGFHYTKQLEDLYLNEFEEYKKIASKVFDPAIFRMMEKENGEISREANNPALRTTDMELVKELGIYAVYMNGSRRSILPAAIALQKNGEELITYLKKEYHLE